MRHVIPLGLAYFALQSLLAAGHRPGYLVFALVFVALAAVSYRLLRNGALL